MHVDVKAFQERNTHSGEIDSMVIGVQNKHPCMCTFAMILTFGLFWSNVLFLF